MIREHIIFYRNISVVQDIVRELLAYKDQIEDVDWFFLQDKFNGCEECELTIKFDSKSINRDKITNSTVKKLLQKNWWIFEMPEDRQMFILLSSYDRERNLRKSKSFAFIPNLWQLVKERRKHVQSTHSVE